MMNNQSSIKIDYMLDLKGLNCPQPILKTKQQLSKMKSGEVVKILATDPHSEIDLKAYLQKINDILLDIEYEKTHIGEVVYIFYIKKV